MTNDAELKPALTREQWLAVLSDPYWYEYQGPQHGGSSQPHITSRHGKAATALYGQPFGFTPEDVAMLRGVAQETRFMEKHVGAYSPQFVSEYSAEAMDSIADRIAALLPPIEHG